MRCDLFDSIQFMFFCIALPVLVWLVLVLMLVLVFIEA